MCHEGSVDTELQTVTGENVLAGIAISTPLSKSSTNHIGRLKSKVSIPIIFFSKIY